MKEYEMTSDLYVTGIAALKSDAWIKNTKVNLVSDAMVTWPESSIICDGELIENLVDEFGTKVIVQTVDKEFEDEYGNPTQNFTDHHVKAIVQRYTATDLEVREGVFKMGEIIFTFSQSDERIVVPGSIVWYQGERFQIDSVIKQPLAQTLYYLQAKVEKY